MASLGLETTSEAAQSHHNGRKFDKKRKRDSVVIVEEPEQEIEGDEMTVDDSASGAADTNVLVEKRTADPGLAATFGESQRDNSDARIRFAEKKRLNWRGQTCPSSFRS